MSKKNGQVPTIRPSAAEYLTFVAAVGDTQSSFEMRYEYENIWLTQKMMATLYSASVSAINQHLKPVFADHELEEDAVIKQHLITATDGNKYNTKHYSLQAIIAAGFKIENERGVQFRKWASKIVKDYTTQDWTMDDDLKENDFNLNIPRYVDTFEEEVEIDIEAVHPEMDTLEEKLTEVRDKMVNLLKEVAA